MDSIYNRSSTCPAVALRLELYSGSTVLLAFTSCTAAALVFLAGSACFVYQKKGKNLVTSCFIWHMIFLFKQRIKNLYIQIRYTCNSHCQLKQKWVELKLRKTQLDGIDQSGVHHRIDHSGRHRRRRKTLSLVRNRFSTLDTILETSEEEEDGADEYNSSQNVERWDENKTNPIEGASQNDHFTVIAANDFTFQPPPSSSCRNLDISNNMGDIAKDSNDFCESLEVIIMSEINSGVVETKEQMDGNHSLMCNSARDTTTMTHVEEMGENWNMASINSPLASGVSTGRYIPNVMDMNAEKSIKPCEVRLVQFGDDLLKDMTGSDLRRKSRSVSRKRKPNTVPAGFIRGRQKKRKLPEFPELNMVGDHVKQSKIPKSQSANPDFLGDISCPPSASTRSKATTVMQITLSGTPLKLCKQNVHSKETNLQKKNSGHATTYPKHEYFLRSKKAVNVANFEKSCHASCCTVTKPSKATKNSQCNTQTDKTGVAEQGSHAAPGKSTDVLDIKQTGIKRQDKNNTKVEKLPVTKRKAKSSDEGNKYPIGRKKGSGASSQGCSEGQKGTRKRGFTEVSKNDPLFQDEADIMCKNRRKIGPSNMKLRI